MSLVLLLIFGFAPSFIWLLFYLRRDQHPESNSMVLKVFVWGMLITPLALLLELVLAIPFGTSSLAKGDDLFGQPLVIVLILVAVVPALVEEFLKYQVVRQKVLHTSHFDEPLDIMLYMVIAGLGFAAVENFSQALELYLDGHSHVQILWIILIRFLGATLLHTLSCGIFGYFIALSLIRAKQRIKLCLIGFGFAWFIHFCYNGMIVLIDKFKPQSITLPRIIHNLDVFLLSLSFYCFMGLVLFLVLLAIINLVLFGKLKNKPSTCQVVD